MIDVLKMVMGTAQLVTAPPMDGDTTFVSPDCHGNGLTVVDSHTGREIVPPNGHPDRARC